MKGNIMKEFLKTFTLDEDNNSHFIVWLPNQCLNLNIHIEFIEENTTESQPALRIKKSNGIVFKNRLDNLKRNNFNEHILKIDKNNSQTSLTLIKNEKIKEDSFLVFSPTTISKNSDFTTYNNSKTECFKFTFSESLDDLRLGFVDKPNYFKGE